MWTAAETFTRPSETVAELCRAGMITAKRTKVEELLSQKEKVKDGSGRSDYSLSSLDKLAHSSRQQEAGLTCRKNLG